MMVSNNHRMSAPWASSLIIISSVLLICIVSWSLFTAEDSSKLIDELRSNFVSSPKEAHEAMKSRMEKLTLEQNMASFQAVGFACQTEQHSEQCITNNKVRISISTNQVTIYVRPSSGSKAVNKTTQMIKPYAQRDDPNCMRLISPTQIRQGNFADSALPSCKYNHAVPALVFSAGGFLENMFHSLDEFLIPLFLTTRHFKSEIQFYITDYNPLVVNKYRQFLRRLSKFEPIDASTNGTSTHCFPGAIIGLNYHGNVAVNYSDIPSGYTMTDFRRFLYESYDLKASDVAMRPARDKPLMVLITRSKSRVLNNQNEVVRLIKDVGFDVHVALEKEMSNFKRFARVLSKCDVLAGVHGAGLSNSVFLPLGAVLLQVVPLALQWPGRYTYGDPAIRMGLRHMEYMIEPKESSLLQTYSPDDPVIIDPESIFAKGYMVGRAVYLEGQNVTLDLNRFKVTLLRVLLVLRSSVLKSKVYS